MQNLLGLDLHGSSSSSKRRGRRVCSNDEDSKCTQYDAVFATVYQQILARISRDSDQRRSPSQTRAVRGPRRMDSGES